MTTKLRPPPGRAGGGQSARRDQAKDHSPLNSATGIRRQPDHLPKAINDRVIHDVVRQSPVSTAETTSHFTPASVFELLHAVLKGTAKLPRATEPSVAYLANALNILRHETQRSIEPWREEPERLKNIDEAIRVLVEVLPEQLDYFAGIARQSGPKKETAEARIKAHRALIACARKARTVGLPKAVGSLFLPVPPIKGWMDIAYDLRGIFNYALPGRPKASMYRFIMVVAPAITGESPTLEAVKTAFKRKRVVNRVTEWIRSTQGQT